MWVKCTPLLELKAIKIVGNIVRRGVTLSKEVVLPSVRIAAAQITSDVLLEDMVTVVSTSPCSSSLANDFRHFNTAVDVILTVEVTSLLVKTRRNMLQVSTTAK